MNTTARKRYPSDLTDVPWHNIAHLFPQGDGSRGWPRIYPVHQIVNAILYLARSGCSWRRLPHDFPPWKTVSYSFYTWRDQGVWERVHASLRQSIRLLDGREPTPRAGILDSMIHRLLRFQLSDKNRDDDLLKRPPKRLKPNY